MSTKNSASEFKKLRGLIAMAMARAARTFTIISVATNRAQSLAAAGSVVAAGGNIVPALTFTPIKTGKVRVSGYVSFPAPAVSGTAKFGLNVRVGLVITQYWSGAPTIGGGAFEMEIDGLAVGTPATFNFVTTAGDSSITLGTGVTGDAASLLVQELL
jgi:hypothetical protein